MAICTIRSQSRSVGAPIAGGVLDAPPSHLNTIFRLFSGTVFLKEDSIAAYEHSIEALNI